MECAWTSSLQGSPPRRQTTARLHFRWDIWQYSPAILLQGPRPSLTMMFRTDFTVFPTYCLTHSLSAN